MSHAEICPVCGGTGKVRKKIEQAGPATTTDAPLEVTCNGCHGRGWIEVGAPDFPREVPVAPERWPWRPYSPVWIIDYGQYTSDGLPVVRYRV
jgi:hypothetical protein